MYFRILPEFFRMLPFGKSRVISLSVEIYRMAPLSYVVRAFAHSAMVVGSILHGEPIELVLVRACAPRLVKQRPWNVISCMWDDAYKRTFAANRKE